MPTRRLGATSQSLVTTRMAAIAMIIAVRIKNAVVTLRKSRTAPHTPQDSYSSAGAPAL
jgi:hypothetical protein